MLPENDMRVAVTLSLFQCFSRTYEHRQVFQGVLKEVLHYINPLHIKLNRILSQIWQRLSITFSVTCVHAVLTAARDWMYTLHQEIW